MTICFIDSAPIHFLGTVLKRHRPSESRPRRVPTGIPSKLSKKLFTSKNRQIPTGFKLPRPTKFQKRRRPRASFFVSGIIYLTGLGVTDCFEMPRKKQIYSLSCRAFPKDTLGRCFPLRSVFQGLSLDGSLHINGMTLTGRDGKQQSGSSLWRLYVRARLRAPELVVSAGLSTRVQLPPSV